MRELDRREFILGAGAASVALNIPRRSEASEKNFQFLSSTLLLKQLEHQKDAAVTSLTESIPSSTKAEYLRTYARYLPLESQMYIPGQDDDEDEDALKKVVAKSESQLNTLGNHMEAGSSGLFIYADVDDKNTPIQKLYVLKKTSSDTLQFVKAYRVSMSDKGFGNRESSDQTPTGLHFIKSGERGLFGEVVSTEQKNQKLFNPIADSKGRVRWFVWGFGDESANYIPEVVTDRYTIDEERGIHIHGTNRSGFWDAVKERWITFLGGKRRSGGCIRMSNTDVRDLSLSGYITLPKSTKAKSIGTLVMIHATPEALRLPPSEKRPPRWIPPVENTPVIDTKASKRPQRWIPPRE